MKASDKRGKGQAQMTREEALACVPVRNPRVEENQTAGGELILSYPIRVRPWFAFLFGRFNKNKDGTVIKKLQLDELGTVVWGLIDGRRTVKMVIEQFGHRYQLHTREAEVSVTQFLRELGRRGIIGLQ